MHKSNKFLRKSLSNQKKTVPLRPQCPDGGIGRRAGLKHQWIHFHAGSTPALGTTSGFGTY